MNQAVYPVIILSDGDWYVVRIPDFDCETQGKDMAAASFMAKDAIGLMGITYNACRRVFTA